MRSSQFPSLAHGQTRGRSGAPFREQHDPSRLAGPGRMFPAHGSSTTSYIVFIRRCTCPRQLKSGRKHFDIAPGRGGRWEQTLCGSVGVLSPASRRARATRRFVAIFPAQAAPSDVPSRPGALPSARPAGSRRAARGLVRPGEKWRLNGCVGPQGDGISDPTGRGLETVVHLVNRCTRIARFAFASGFVTPAPPRPRSSFRTGWAAVGPN